MSETTAATAIGKVSTVMVPVADQDRAIEFYTEKLGFEEVADIPFGDGDRWVAVGPAGAATTIALVKPRDGETTFRKWARGSSGTRYRRCRDQRAVTSPISTASEVHRARRGSLATA